jgi:hypothetical protein
MKLNENDRVEIRKLVNLYFQVNPNMNKGFAFKTKAWDIISAYYKKHNKAYEEIEHCIESDPMTTKPIWTAFYDYFYKDKPKKSEYKNSIDKSLNPDDWL